MGETPEAIQALVEFIKEGIRDSCDFWRSPRTRKGVLEPGTVTLLIDILTQSDKTELVTDTLALLATLADNM